MKMSRILTLALGLAILPSLPALAAPPEVSNIRPSQRAGTKLIDVYYDLADTEGDTCTVAITIFDNTSPLPVYAITGDVGPGVTPGTDRHIVWNAGQDWNRRFTTQGKARIVADDAPTTAPDSNTAFVPAGFSNPGVEIYTSGFFMDKYEINGGVWEPVYNWAVSNGYTFDNAGRYTNLAHPVQGVNWYDVVKWCNARSEMSGLTPCYYTDAAKTQVYRSGQVALSNDWVAWETDGYRLPTRAEWLKAYWGGNYGGYYPWPSYGGSAQDHINGGYANYQFSGDPFETQLNTSNTTTPTGYYNGTQTPAGPDTANGFGLYDMVGNVSEWLWDRELSAWYSLPESRDDNSRGPDTGLGSMRSYAGQHDSNSTETRRQLYAPATEGYWLRTVTNGDSRAIRGLSSIGLRCVRSR